MTFLRPNKRLIGRIRIFFRSRTWRNALTFLAFAAVATVFRIAMPEGGQPKAKSDGLDTIAIGLQRLNINRFGTDSDRRGDQATIVATIDTLVVAIRCAGLPSSRKAMFFPPEVTLFIQSTDSQRHQPRVIDFDVTVDYSKLSSATSSACMPIISRKPTWAGDIRISPTVVEFIFE
jgi:hypothetical protein